MVEGLIDMDWSSVKELVGKALEGIVREVDEGKGYIAFIVDRDDIIEAARKLKDLGFDHVKSLTVSDYPKEGKFRVIYHASSYLNEELSKFIVGVGYDVDRSNPRVPSLVYVWRSVEFQEREVYEFFGIEFTGHPDLRPLLLAPPLAEEKPLRKEFTVKEEPIIRVKPPSG